MFNTHNLTKFEIKFDDKSPIDKAILLHGDKISLRFDIKCVYNVKVNGENMKVQYSLIMNPHDYRPYGIKSLLINSDDRIIDESDIVCRFATISEAVHIMLMFAKESVLPYTVDCVME